MKPLDNRAEENPIFSIIVPVYKTEQYLHQCVESILAQSFQSFELILVDDGSPDGSGAMCDRYAESDERIRIVHKENGGLVSARKAGARCCMGDYVINVDSDDYITADLLEKLGDIIRTHKPDVVIYDGFRFNEEMRMDFCGTMPAGLYAGDKMSLIRDSVIHDKNHQIAIQYGVCLKAVRRDLYLKYQMCVPEKISIGEDLSMTAPLLTQCESVFVSGIQGYYYRDNPKSIMNTFQKSEVEQIRLLSDYLQTTMTAEYKSRIAAYVVMHYFDFLDRAMQQLDGLRSYRELIRETADQQIMRSLKQAKCTSARMIDHLIFWLMRHHYFSLVWILRHIKRRKI